MRSRRVTACVELRMCRIAAVGALACMVFFVVFGAPASAAQSRNYTGISFGPDGAGGTESFVSVQGVAIDPADGDIYVFDGGDGEVYKFDSVGAPVDFSATGTNSVEGAGTAGSGEGELAIAPPGSPGATAGDIYVATIAKVAVYSPAGEPIGELTAEEAGGETCGVATDPSGHIFVNVFNGGIHEYVPKTNPFKAEDETDHSASELREIGACNVAADTLGNFYAASFNGNNGTAELEGLADPEPSVVDSSANTIAVASEGNDLYADRGDEIRQYDSAGNLLGAFGSGALSGSVGIALSPDDAKVYVGASTKVRIYGPSLILPEAETRTPTEVTADSAVLKGTINAEGGPPATCFFEYVEVAAKGFEGAATAPCSPAGPYSGTNSVLVSAPVSGLAEGFYRVRLVARNEFGPIEGNIVVFENSALAATALPDERSYELVSPAQKGGEVIPPHGIRSCEGECPGENSTILPMQAAPDGESVVYEGLPFGAGLAPGFDQYLSHRGSSDWGLTNLSSATVSGDWRAFSADLSRGVLYQAEPALSSATPTRGGVPFADLYLVSESGPPVPLVTVEPPNRDPSTRLVNGFRIRYAAVNSGTAGTPAFSHLTFEANDALTPAVAGIAPQAPEVAAGEGCAVSFCDLYEWQGGALRLINVLPGNAIPATEAVIGSGKMLAPGVEEVPVVSNAVSADGNRVFWTDVATGQTYVRVGGAETLPIPGPATCKESEPLTERACFLNASEDGTRVLLSNGQTYKLDPSGAAYEPSGDLTQGHGGFQGILGAASDFSRVFFVDTAALTPESEVNANGEYAQAGRFNLYLGKEEQDGLEIPPRFIGALSESDLEFGASAGTWKPSPSNRTAQVTTDGGYLAFMSSAPLTGYDNELPGGGKASEVFEYDASSATLTCTSCNPGAHPPLGSSSLSLIKVSSGETPALRPLGNLSAASGGRLFFESKDVLSSRDLNGAVQDVYEWEPAKGLGSPENDSCKKPDGCVSLISAGTSPDRSLFLDSTPSGNDAFFITRSSLVERDKDDQYDVYDARVRGGFSEEARSPCAGEACKGQSSAPPPRQLPASSTFTGPGNAKPACKSGFVRKHGKCVKRPHKKQDQKKHKRKDKQNKKKSKDKRAGHGRGGAR
jgi:hypothetical protein